MRRLLAVLALVLLPAFAQAATVTVAGTTWNTTAGNKTQTSTPAVSDLIIVITGTSGVAGGTTAVSDNNSDGLGAYTQITPQRTQSTNSKRLEMWVRNSLIGSGTSTIYTATQASSTGGGLTVLRVSGMTRTGSSAILQDAGQDEQAASSTPAPTFGATTLTGNVIIGAVVNGTNPATLTIPSGFAAEAADVGYATPNTGLHVVYRNSGFVGTTVTWGSTSSNVYCDKVIELDTSVPASCAQSIALLGVGCR